MCSRSRRCSQRRAEDTPVPVAACVGQCAGGILPRCAPDLLGIGGYVLEQVDFIHHCKRWIDTPCDVVIALCYLCDDLTTRCAETQNRAEQFPQKLILVVHLGSISNADKPSTILNKGTQRPLLFQREGNNGTIQNNNPLCGEFGLQCCCTGHNGVLQISHEQCNSFHRC